MESAEGNDPAFESGAYGILGARYRVGALVLGEDISLASLNEAQLPVVFKEELGADARKAVPCLGIQGIDKSGAGRVAGVAEPQLALLPVMVCYGGGEESVVKKLLNWS